MTRSLLLRRSEGWWRDGLWLRLSFEIPFKNPSEDSKHYHEANHIVDYRRDCANPIRAVDIQFCLNTVLHLQYCESKQQLKNLKSQRDFPLGIGPVKYNPIVASPPSLKPD